MRAARTVGSVASSLSISSCAQDALGFGAVPMLADVMGALNTLLVELLPEVEPIIVRAYAPIE
jgi:hypothetical protein